MQRLKVIRLFEEKKKNIDKGTRKGMIERRNKNRANTKKGTSISYINISSRYRLKVKIEEE